MTDLNVHLLKPDELVKYCTPTTELETALYEAVKVMVKESELSDEDAYDTELRREQERDVAALYTLFFDRVVEQLEEVTGQAWNNPYPDDDSLLDIVIYHMSGKPDEEK